MCRILLKECGRQQALRHLRRCVLVQYLLHQYFIYHFMLPGEGKGGGGQHKAQRWRWQWIDFTFSETFKCQKPGRRQEQAVWLLLWIQQGDAEIRELEHLRWEAERGGVGQVKAGKAAGGNLSMHKHPMRACEENEPNSSQWCSEEKQETMDTNWNRENSI